MATKYNSSITEKRIESPKLPIILSTLAILLSSIAVIVSLSVGGYDFIYFVFPIALVACDAVFIVLTLFSNYRFRYSIPFPTVYLVLTVLLTVITVLTDGGSNGTDLFTHFAIYFFLSLHLLAALAVALGYMNAAKVGKKPAVIKNISTVTAIVLFLATCVYSYTVFINGWFGQGAVGVHRPLQYTYNSESDSYEVVGVLSGRGDTVSIPATFNDKPVTKVDCSIFETQFIRNIYIEADINYTDLENRHLLYSPDRTIYAKNYENIRQGFFDEAVATTSQIGIGIANSVVPHGLEDGKVYVTFTYGLEDLIAVGGEVIPVWVGNAGDAISDDFLGAIDYIAHKLDNDNLDNNHWSYENVGKRIYKSIAGLPSKVNESRANLLVEFEPLMKIEVAEDNDTVHPELDSFKYYEYDGEMVDNILTLSQAEEWFATYETRQGFDLDWYLDSAASGTRFDDITAVAADGMVIVPNWTMKAPTISEISSSDRIIYGQDATFDHESSLAYAGFDIAYRWSFDGVTVSTDKSFGMTNVRPEKSGTYTLTVTSHNDAITSLTATATKTVDLTVGKRALRLDWTLPVSGVYDATNKTVSWAVNPENDEGGNDTFGVINGDIIEFVETYATIKNVRIVDGHGAAYEFTAQLKGECSDLYYLPTDQANNRFEITPAPLTVVWGSTNFIYNSSEQAPTATAAGVGTDGQISLNITGAIRNAGLGTAVAMSANSNYEVKTNGTTAFTVDPYTLDVSWNSGSFVYNAATQKPTATATGLGNDGTISFVTTGEGKDVYTGYSASVDLDVTGNYKASPSTNTTTFNITQRPISLTWNYGNSVVYNGTQWVYKVTASNVAGNDQLSFNYSYDGTESTSTPPKDAGDGYLVTATLNSLDSINSNYVISGQNSISVTVEKLPIKLVWSTASLVYNAAAQSVSVADFTGLAASLVNEATEDLIYSGNSNTYANTYIASVSLALDSNFTIESGDTHSYTIEKRPIRLTWGASSFTYDGQFHTVTASVDNPAPTHTVDNIINYTGNSSVDAATYTARAVLIDENYEITSGETRSYTIAKRTLTVNWALVSNRVLTYDGNAWEWAATLTGAVESEHPTVLLSYKSGSTTLGGAPTDAGSSYSVTAALDGSVDTNKNYTLTGQTKSFQVAKRIVYVAWANLTQTFTGSTLTPTASFEGVAADGTVSLNDKIVGGAKTNAATYNVSIQNFTHTNYQLEAGSTSAQFKITPMDVTVEWSADSFIYNGTKQLPIPTVYNAGQPLSIADITVNVSSGSQSSTNVGSYTVLVTLNGNYNITDGATHDYSITAREVGIFWGQTTFVYTGSKQTPSVSVKEVGGASLPSSISTGVTVSVSGAVNVGSYQATAVINNSNLVIVENETATIEITPLNVTITWSPSTFVYSGAQQMPVATIKNGGATVPVSIAAASISVISGDGISAGSHTAKATLNNDNLVITSGETYQYTITKMNVNLNWSATSYTYNGQVQIPTVAVTTTSGKDVTSLAGAHVALESGAGITAGSYKAIATLDNTNMTISGVNYTTYTINKMTVQISWSNTSFTYTGSVQMPTATVKTTGGAAVSGVSASVSLTNGNGTDAGTNTVKATLSDTANYQISGTTGTKSYTIAEKTVSVSWNGLGSVPTVTGAPASAYKVQYYNGSTLLSGLPTAAGSYTVRVTLNDTVNYKFASGAKTISDFVIEA